MVLFYGEEICGFNVYNFSYIVECVENWGFLWVYLCFFFDLCNGEILKVIYGKGNVSGEVYWVVYSEKIFENEIKLFLYGKVKVFLKEIMLFRNIFNNENFEVGE